MSAKIFIGSVLVSILILAPATYFLLPILYPGMNDVTIDETGFEYIFPLLTPFDTEKGSGYYSVGILPAAHLN